MTDQPAEPTSTVASTDETARVAVFAQRTLEQLEIGTQRHLPERVIVESEWQQISDTMRVMRVEMTGYVLAEKIAQDKYTKSRIFPFPSSPWQFFKENRRSSRWLGWFVKRFPVIYERHTMSVTVHVDRYLSYPQAEIAQGMGPSVIAEVVTCEEQVPDRVQAGPVWAMDTAADNRQGDPR